MGKNIIVLFILLTILVFFGCTHRTILPDDFHISKPASVSKIPLRAGLYLHPAFENFKFIGNKGQGKQVPIELGGAITTAAKISMREVFENVVMVQNIDSDLTAKDIDIIIFPSIEKVDNMMASAFPFVWDSYFICKWSIKGRNGKLLYVNTVTGEGHYKSSFNSNKFAESVVPAVQDHFNKLTAHLLSTKWWENINVKDATP
jgi:hypothetical protein